MTNDNRIPCPSLSTVLDVTLALVRESPNQTSRHAYLDSAGAPHDLIGHVLTELWAPIFTAASGTHEFNGTKQNNTTRLPNLWNRLFLGEGPYDSRFTMFLGATRDPKVANDFLVYALLTKIQEALDGGLPWKAAAVRGLKSFRRWLTSSTSGFLVQTRGGNEAVYKIAVSLTAKAIAELTK